MWTQLLDHGKKISNLYIGDWLNRIHSIQHEISENLLMGGVCTSSSIFQVGLQYNFMLINMSS